MSHNQRLDIDTFIQEIQHKENPDEIEFELKLFLDKQYHNGKLVNIGYSNDEVKKIFRTLFATLSQEHKMEEHQYINLISKDGINKQFKYLNGIKIEESKLLYSKTRIKDYFMSHNGISWKLKACREHKLDQFNDAKTIYNLIRYKRRFSTTISNEWRIDYTFVSQLPYHSNANAIKEARENLFLNEVHRIYDIANCIEVEVEYIKPLKTLTASSIEYALSSFPKCIELRPTIELYDHAINQLKEMFSEKITRNNTRRLSIKQLLPQTITLSKKKYFSIIAESKYGEYYVSQKLDGERVLLFISDQNAGYLTTTKWHDIKLMNPASSILILDCEFYKNTFYVFDILKYVCIHNEMPYTLNMYKCPFLLRRECLTDLQSKLENLSFANSAAEPMSIRIKSFTKLGESYPSTLNAIMNQKTDFPSDGIIFTSIRDPYLSTDYLKWKPPNKMTIEFVAKKCPNEILGSPPYTRRRNHTLYMLYVGIRSDMIKAFRMRRLRHYHLLFPILERADYIPIHFAPSSDPLAYLYWSDRNDLDNKIIEMIWSDAKWQLVGIRQDRHADYLNNQYFGNDYSVAESIWNTYHNPFSYDQLQLSCNEMKQQFYFIEDNSEQHRGIRKFNNWVKAKLLESVGQSQHWIIDLGSGKGQDFIKYINLNIQNVIFIDNNVNNIDEIITRKYLYYKQGHFRKTQMAIHTICSDVMKPKFTAEVMKCMPFCKLIVCNFAVHYMCYNRRTSKSFAAIISELLQPDGRFMCTYLNGKKIFNRIMDNEETDYSEWIAGKYHIRRYFQGDTYTGANQKISIKLPFSDGFYYEYLFDIDMLTKALKPFKITLETRGEFNEFVQTYQHNSEMNNRMDNYGLQADDLEYVPLLEYAIYHKK
jgi:hypothetical protein